MITLFNEYLPSIFDDYYFDKGINYLPKIKINKEKNGYELKFALPGLKKDDINIKVNNGIISISYSKETSTFVSKFKKSYNIPSDIDTDNISGKFEDGILNVKLPIKEEIITEKVIEII